MIAMAAVFGAVIALFAAYQLERIRELIEEQLRVMSGGVDEDELEDEP
jgi:hypothetical protein